MSTRGSIFYHYDESSGVTTHIYEETIDGTIHIEIEHAHGVTNVIWPQKEFVTDVLQNPERSELWTRMAEPRVRDWTKGLESLRSLVSCLKDTKSPPESASGSE
jgi:hypothetical protein